MPVSARLNNEIIFKLETISKIEKISKSKIIEKSIIEYFNNHIPSNTPYELGKSFFGKSFSKKSNLSKDRKKILKDKLHAKYSHN